MGSGAANFKVHKDVKTSGKSSHLSFIGYKIGGLTPEMDYQVGVYGFSNPITATMYAYLSGHADVGAAVARTCAEQLEEKLQNVGMLSSLGSITPLDVVAAVVPYGKLVEAGSKISGFAGDAVDAARLTSGASAARYNPYTPNGKLYWGGWGHNQYISYAMAYWKKYPSYGPAYQIGVIS